MFTIPKALIKPSASTPFTLSANNSDVFFDAPLNAQNSSFYIGNVTESSCPSTVKLCPPGNVTALRTSARGEAQMDVQVPAGQQVYVDVNGALRYTVAHSNVIPPGGLNQTFSLFRGKPTYFTFSGVGKASGFLACPVPSNSTVWQVYADLPSLTDENIVSQNISACLGFDALATNYKGFAAWQYE
ncbi:MAG: hypothetical protein Q9191_002931 [Dirinaria sp. TL-2023a]